MDAPFSRLAYFYIRLYALSYRLISLYASLVCFIPPFQGHVIGCSHLIITRMQPSHGISIGLSWLIMRFMNEAAHFGIISFSCIVTTMLHDISSSPLLYIWRILSLLSLSDFQLIWPPIEFLSWLCTVGLKWPSLFPIVKFHASSKDTQHSSQLLFPEYY